MAAVCARGSAAAALVRSTEARTALSGDPAYLFFARPSAVKRMLKGDARRPQGRIVSEKELDGIIAEHDRDGDGRIDAVRARAANPLRCTISRGEPSS